MFFRHWSIGRKLTAVLASILVLFMGSSALSLYQTREQDRILNHMVGEVLLTERALANWSKNVTAGVQRAAAIAKSTDTSLVAYFDKATKDATADTARQMKIIEANLKSPHELQMLAEASKLRDAYLSLRKDIAALKNAGRMGEAEQVFTNRFEPTMQAYLDKVAELTEYQRQQLDTMAHRSAELRADSMVQLMIFSAAALALGIWLAIAVTRSITEPLQRANAAAKAMAALDLSQPAQTHYTHNETGELLQSIDQMRDALNRTMAQVLQASQSISTASAQVSSGSNDLSSRTENTAANLEESAAAIEELSTSAQQCSDSTRQAEHLSRNSLQATQLGFEKARLAQDTMQEIQQSSQKIGDIIGVIDGIAFQTNILALNAAVEAARAGEQGRGFAVVAGEVRTLAQRSAAAAKEIRQLINSNLQSVTAGNNQVQEAGAAMRDILDNVTRVQDIVSEVNAATLEQSTGATQINQSIAQLDQMTQQNAALVEESSAAAGHLYAQAEQLRKLVDAFRLAEQHLGKPSPAGTAHLADNRQEPALLGG